MVVPNRQKAHPPMFTLEHDGKSFDFATLPLASQRALAYAGLVHHRGNRVASRVVGHFRTKGRIDYIATHGDEAWKGLAKAAQADIERAAMPDTESEEYVQAYREFRAETDSAIAAGTLGEGRESAPKQTPLEAEVQAIAKREVIEILTKQGMFAVTGKKRVPKSDDEFTFASGPKSFAACIAGRLAKFGDRIEKEAKAELARREKAVAKVGAEDLEEAF